MDTREWALIIFTILAQMSVGSFIVLGVMHFFAQRKAGVEQADRLANGALLAVVPTLGLGILASFFHLGNPLNGYLAVLRLGGSWLSREIFLGVVFAALAALFVIMQWFKISSLVARNVVALLGVVAGLALIFSMSRTYMLKTVPVWNTLYTPVSFFVTTFLLGVLAMGAALVANYAYVRRKSPDCADVQCTLLRDMLRWVAIVGVVLLGVEFLVVPAQLAFLSASVLGVQSITNVAGEFMPVFVLRLALVFLGAGVLGLFVYQNASSPGREKIMGNLTYVAFVLVLVGEVLGRFLFYASFAKIGMF